MCRPERSISGAFTRNTLFFEKESLTDLGIMNGLGWMLMKTKGFASICLSSNKNKVCAHEVQHRTCDILELELQATVSYHVDAGTLIFVFCTKYS